MNIDDFCISKLNDTCVINHRKYKNIYAIIIFFRSKDMWCISPQYDPNKQFFEKDFDVAKLKAIMLISNYLNNDGSKVER